MKYVEFETLVGQVITKVSDNSDSITFETESGKTYRMFHDQDCCESVGVEDIDGDLQDLVGQEVLVAETRTKDDEEDDERAMWTFYTIRTVKTSLTIRWYGSSNGYYAVDVEFAEV